MAHDHLYTYHLWSWALEVRIELSKTNNYWAVTIQWTGLLDWNTGLDYWTEVISFFGQDSGECINTGLDYWNGGIVEWWTGFFFLVF